MKDSSRTRPASPPDIDTLREQAQHCKACDLWRRATQTVFGEGRTHARIMLIGEQPGDSEDLAGRPFVGPAGALLDRALAAAGLDRKKLYVTNAVKHFSWELRGKRRLHKTPAQQEIEACRRWLDAELAALRPLLVICLGVTAARAVMHKTVKLGDVRGRIFENETAPALLFTVHPSYVLRVPSGSRSAAFDALVADLRVAAGFAAN
jgi:uracil-DNA glycosylase family protein